jgi:ribose transport system ATP-binding protein
VRLENLLVYDLGTIRDFSAELARGEVVGLTGLIGSGYDEVIYMAYGAVPAACPSRFAQADHAPRRVRLAG